MNTILNGGYEKVDAKLRRVYQNSERSVKVRNVNLFTKKFYYVEEDCWISLNISASGLSGANLVNSLMKEN